MHPADKSHVFTIIFSLVVIGFYLLFFYDLVMQILQRIWDNLTRNSYYSVLYGDNILHFILLCVALIFCVFSIYRSSSFLLQRNSQQQHRERNGFVNGVLLLLIVIPVLLKTYAEQWQCLVYSNRLKDVVVFDSSLRDVSFKDKKTLDKTMEKYVEFDKYLIYAKVTEFDAGTFYFKNVPVCEVLKLQQLVDQNNDEIQIYDFGSNSPVINHTYRGAQRYGKYINVNDFVCETEFKCKPFRRPKY